MQKESVTVQRQVVLVSVIHPERLMCMLNTWRCFLKFHKNVQAHLELCSMIRYVISRNHMN